MATPIDPDAMCPDLTIWLPHRNMNVQNPVRPWPTAELTEDGFFDDELMAPTAAPYPPISASYDFLDGKHTDLELGPSAQDAFEMQLNEYFDRNIPATAARHATEYESMLTVHQSPKARDRNFAFYGGQRGFAFLKDRHAGRYASEPALVSSRFGTSVFAVNGELGRHSTNHGGPALESRHAQTSGGKKSGGKSRKAVVLGESAHKIHSRQAASNVLS